MINNCKINIKGVGYIDKKRYVNNENNLIKLQKIIKLFLVRPIKIIINNEEVSHIKHISSKLNGLQEKKQ